ncbi:hypothetical protein COLO4_37416 [Corchorus olitorius]|uniref:Uncharacterized protein n=1 Tax=Corchorus olitorius TaxID=93759 RepID=A0A1R3G209_9ROSI|nr:hypothetical protein COLO4_37416 [Corchorus olitorius]
MPSLISKKFSGKDYSLLSKNRQQATGCFILMFNIASRSASGPPCGTRIVAGHIVKESYG